MSQESLLVVESALEPSNRQRLFLRYLFAILIDLVVLNLFAQYWDHVYLSSFSISLLAAVLLQVLLKMTLHIEHIVADFFNAKSGALAKFMRYLSAWAILFISKFIILAAINQVFGASVVFSGALHGVIAFIVVVFAMLLAEELMVRFYQRLGKSKD